MRAGVNWNKVSILKRRYTDIRSFFLIRSKYLGFGRYILLKFTQLSVTVEPYT